MKIPGLLEMFSCSQTPFYSTPCLYSSRTLNVSTPRFLHRHSEHYGQRGLLLYVISGAVWAFRDTGNDDSSYIYSMLCFLFFSLSINNSFKCAALPKVFVFFVIFRPVFDGRQHSAFCFHVKLSVVTEDFMLDEQNEYNKPFPDPFKEEKIWRRAVAVYTCWKLVHIRKYYIIASDSKDQTMNNANIAC